MVLWGDDLISGEDNELDLEQADGLDSEDEDVDSVADSKQSSHNEISPVTKVAYLMTCKFNCVLENFKLSYTSNVIVYMMHSYNNRQHSYNQWQNIGRIC